MQTLALAEGITCSNEELSYLRGLATTLKEIAEQPIQQSRIKLWTMHNDLEVCRPILYFSPEGAWQEIITPESLRCEHKVLKQWERYLLQTIHQHTHMADDIPVEAMLPIYKNISDDGWGLELKKVAPTRPGGAWTFSPAIEDFDDVKKLRHPTARYNEEQTMRRYNAAQEALGDIIEIRLLGKQHISFHLNQLLTRFRGMDDVFMDMYEEPELLHDCLEIFTTGYLSLVNQWLDQGLIDYNNNNAYQGSGGRGWTKQLPRDGASPDKPTRLSDLWASAEDQELTVVGPDHHREFAFDYVKRLLEPFGLTAYGCCENVTHKLEDVLSLPQIRRVSTSPWSDVTKCSERIGREAIVSWKPHPTLIAVDWNADKVREALREGLSACKTYGTNMEIIMKDTHTCCDAPERFDHFGTIAREEIANAGFDTETFPFAEPTESY